MERLTFKKNFQFCNPQEKTTTVCVNGYTQIVEEDEMSGKQNFFIVGEAIDKLSKYEDAEEQGLLLRLPCKIGDKAWCIRNYKGTKQAKQSIVTEMFYRKDMKLVIVVYHVGRGILGEKVFLTQEEAEQALREMGE